MSEHNNKNNKKDACPFGPNLKKILRERNISQQVAANLANISDSTLNDWLNGVTPSNMQAVLRLAQGLGVSFQWLLTGISEGNACSIEEIFDVADAPELSGLFLVNLKRLSKKK